MQRVKTAVIIILIAIYACSSKVELSTAMKPLSVLIHAVYMFLHANILHLFCNCYALWFVLNDKILKPHALILLLYIISVISSVIVTNNTVIVGASAVVYAAIGINMQGNRSWIAWLVVGASIAMSYFMKNVSTSIHLVAFSMGFISIMLHKQLRGLVNDYRAINRGE